jgi:murein L,D-transpeptidase YcbB/YkuD
MGAALLVLAMKAEGEVAGDGDSDVEALRARVEAIRSGEGQVGRETIAARTLLPAVYESRGFQRAWSEPARADALLRAIRESERDGLDPGDYHLRALDEASRSGSPDDLELDLIRTDALIRLAYHILFGKVDPTSFDPDWNYERVLPDFDPVREIEDALAAPDLAALLEGRKPAHPYYVRLRDALARYRAIGDSGGWPLVPAGAALAPGNSDPRVAALRARLAATGDIASGAGAAAGASAQYDDSLAAAVRRFQARHGLAEDGVVGARTLEELNVPVEKRIDQFRVNLERGRWLLHDLGGTFVFVNIAGFGLVYVRDGAIDWETRVQVGKPYRATPVFRSEITYLVFNPTWTVPPTILREDIIPAQRRDPGTLERMGLKVLDADGTEVPASAVNWSGRSIPYRLRQDPGPTNALGRVKFMFPNAHSVYLHDTPSKNLFDADDRAFSSGCIRVEGPLTLAERLLAGEPDWNRVAIDSAVESGRTRTVTLKTPVPVLLSYWTAWVPRSGEVQFRRDIYGRDAKILAGLASEFRMGRRARIAPAP